MYKLLYIMFSTCNKLTKYYNRKIKSIVIKKTLIDEKHIQMKNVSKRFTHNRLN